MDLKIVCLLTVGQFFLPLAIYLVLKLLPKFFFGGKQKKSEIVSSYFIFYSDTAKAKIINFSQFNKTSVVFDE